MHGGMFVQLYGPLVYHWCCRFGLQEAEAADVGQKVFRTVSSSIVNFQLQQQGSSFRGWLRTVTRTRTIDYLPPQGEGAGSRRWKRSAGDVERFTGQFPGAPVFAGGR